MPLSCHLFVLVGGERTGSNLHKDPKWSSAWNTLLCGRKWAPEAIVYLTVVTWITVVMLGDG